MWLLQCKRESASFRHWNPWPSRACRRLATWSQAPSCSGCCCILGRCLPFLWCAKKSFPPSNAAPCLHHACTIQKATLDICVDRCPSYEDFHVHRLCMTLFRVLWRASCARRLIQVFPACSWLVPHSLQNMCPSDCFENNVV